MSVVVTVAPTGPIAVKSDNPDLPTQPDEIAAAASLVMGQAAEGIPAVLMRGLPAVLGCGSAADLIRSDAENLFP